MKERRSLVEGLTSADTAQEEKEKAFVYGTPATSEESTEPDVVAEQATAPASAGTMTSFDSKVLPQFTGRVLVTTRTRPEVASALKRASLMRQLNGIEPYYVQDIMEEALTSWLKANGHLS